MWKNGFDHWFRQKYTTDIKITTNNTDVRITETFYEILRNALENQFS